MPTTANLNVVELVPSQSNKDVTVSTAFADFDAKIAGLLTLDCSAGGTITLNRSQWLNNTLRLTGTPSGAFNVVVPAANIQPYLIDNGSGQTATVKTPSGTGIAVATGTVQFVRCDGTNVVAVNPVSGGIAFGFSLTGVPTASQYQLVQAPVAFTIPANMASPNSQSKLGTAATASTVFTLKKNGTAIGTITFAASGTTGTLATTGGTSQSVAAGDVLSLVAPASPDATAADLTFTLVGTR